MTLDEIEVIKIINLARLFPKQFLQFEIFDKPEEFNFDSYYVKSLVTELNNRKAVEKLDGSKKMKSLADCFVNEQGPTGETGHQRTFCSKGYFGECCSYGPKNPLEIVLLLLVDEDVPSLGHREICLSSSYQSIGVGIGTHTKYRNMAVLDFDLKKEFFSSKSSTYSSSNSNFSNTTTSNSKTSNSNKSKSFHQKTSLNPFVSVLTVPELDLQKITKSSAFYFGVELEIPFDEDKKLYTAFYSKTGAFLFQPSSTLQNNIGFFGLKNSEGFSITPFQEIGFVFFKHLKLGAGTHFSRHSSFKYQPYYSGGFGFQMDEYEIEIGSLAQNISNTWQFYPSISLKIRPKP